MRASTVAYLLGASLNTAAFLPRTDSSSNEQPAIDVSDDLDVVVQDFAVTAPQASQDIKDPATGLVVSPFITLKQTISQKSDTYNGWDLSVCVGGCIKNNTVDHTLLKDQAMLQDLEPFESMVFNMCNQNYLKCNDECLNVHSQKMKLWPPQSTQADEVYTSTDLETCVIRCDLDAGADVENVATDLAIPNGLFKERATVGQCNTHLGRCVLKCQDEFSNAIEDWDNDHDNT